MHDFCLKLARTATGTLILWPFSEWTILNVIAPAARLAALH